MSGFRGRKACAFADPESSTGHDLLGKITGGRGCGATGGCGGGGCLAGGTGCGFDHGSAAGVPWYSIRLRGLAYRRAPGFWQGGLR
jgi:hypothetical protein